jgi:hypothetical protein
MKTTLLKKIKERFEIIPRMDDTDDVLRVWDRREMAMDYYYGINDFVERTYSKIYLTNPFLKFFDRQINTTNKKRKRGMELDVYYSAKSAGKIYDKMKSLTLDKTAFLEAFKGNTQVKDDEPTGEIVKGGKP